MRVSGRDKSRPQEIKGFSNMDRDLFGKKKKPGPSRLLHALKAYWDCR